MADKKISAMDLITSFKTTMYIPIVDPDEVDAANRNKRITLAQLMGKTTTLTATTYEYGDGSEFGPWLFVFKGTSSSTFTLPAGSSEIVNMPISFANLGTNELNVDGNGTDTINAGGDPFNIPSGDKTVYIFKWTTDGWIVN